jgi:two-component system response regulator RegA
VVEEITQRSPKCRVVILTGYGSIATAVKAIRVGAIDYLTKPATVCAIERALKGNGSVSTAVIQPSDSTKPSLARQEREYIENILADCNGNVTKAAEQLGIHRQSLQRKLRKYPTHR